MYKMYTGKSYFTFIFHISSILNWLLEYIRCILDIIFLSHISYFQCCDRHAEKGDVKLNSSQRQKKEYVISQLIYVDYFIFF